MKFLVAADTQLGLYSKFSETTNDALAKRWNSKILGQFDFKNMKPSKSYDYEINNLDKIITSFDNNEYTFMTILGDLINDYNSEDQYLKFSSLISESKYKDNIYLIPGNHDMNEPPDLKSKSIYNKRFGLDYYEKKHLKYKFLFLNSTILRNNQNLLSDCINQIDLLKNSLINYEQKLFIFMHHSLFYKNIDEDLNGWNINKDIRNTIVQLLTKHQNEVYIFSGHIHKNRVVKFQNIFNISVSSVGVPLGNDPSGYYEVHIDKNKVYYKFINIAD
jgi:predicted phosphodiesterase